MSKKTFRALVAFVLVVIFGAACFIGWGLGSNWGEVKEVKDYFNGWTFTKSEVSDIDNGNGNDNKPNESNNTGVGSNNSGGNGKEESNNSGDDKKDNIDVANVVDYYVTVCDDTFEVLTRNSNYGKVTYPIYRIFYSESNSSFSRYTVCSLFCFNGFMYEEGSGTSADEILNFSASLKFSKFLETELVATGLFLDFDFNTPINLSSTIYGEGYGNHVECDLTNRDLFGSDNCLFTGRYLSDEELSLVLPCFKAISFNEIAPFPAFNITVDLDLKHNGRKSFSFDIYVLTTNTDGLPDPFERPPAKPL